MTEKDFSIVPRAILFAKEKHKDQKRKYTGEPYIYHCLNVANTITDIGGDDEMIAAAVLHDTLEDTDAVFADLLLEFGPRVALMVFDLTDVGLAKGNRAKRKELDRERLANADADVQTIKLADLIDNTASIMEHDSDGFGRVYMREKRALLEVLTKGHPDLMARAKSICEKYPERENEDA